MASLLGDFGATLRFGVVSEVARKPLRYKVTLPDADGLVTPWLPMITSQSSGANSVWPLKTGTQVALLLTPDGELGVVLGAIHSDADPEPDGEGWTQQFSDGTRLGYDEKTKTLTIKSSGPVVISGTAISLQAPKITLNGAVVSTSTLAVATSLTVRNKGFAEHCHTEHDGYQTTGPL